MAGREALTGKIQRGSTTKNTKSTKGPGPLRRRYKSHPFPNRPLKVNQLPLPKGWREAFRRNAFCQPSFVFFVFFVVKNYHTARGAWHGWPGSPDRGNPKRVNHKEHKGHKRTGPLRRRHKKSFFSKSTNDSQSVTPIKGLAGGLSRRRLPAAIFCVLCVLCG